MRYKLLSAVTGTSLISALVLASGAHANPTEVGTPSEESVQQTVDSLTPSSSDQSRSSTEPKIEQPPDGTSPGEPTPEPSDDVLLTPDPETPSPTDTPTSQEDASESLEAPESPFSLSQSAFSTVKIGADLPYETTKTTMLQEEPFEDAPLVEELRKETKVQTVGLRSGDWWLVSVGDSEGWVRHADVVSARSNEDTSSTTVTQIGKNGAYHAVRSTPLRLAADDRHPVLLELSQGSNVVTVGLRYGEWWKVTSGSTVGWVRHADLSSGKSTSTPGKTRVTNIASGAKYVVSRSTSLRLAARESQPLLKSLHAGAQVTTVGLRYGDWWKVKSGSTIGWLKHADVERPSGSTQHPFTFYGTLRQGASAYHIVSPYAQSVTGSKLSGYGLWLHPNGLSYVTNSSSSDSVVVDRTTMRRTSYSAAISRLDRYERYDPSKPARNQAYVRQTVMDAHGVNTWSYLAGPNMATYVKSSGTKIRTGDYLRRG